MRWVSPADAEQPKRVLRYLLCLRRRASLSIYPLRPAERMEVGSGLSAQTVESTH